MRLYLLFFVALFSTPGCQASDTIATHQYGGDIDDFILLSRKCEILLDPAGQYSIKDILEDENPDFSRYDWSPLPPFPFVSWNRVRLTNTGDNTRHDYFINYIYADSIWMYVVDNGVVVEELLTGGMIHPADKYVAGIGAELPFSLAPGQTLDFYFRSKYIRDTPFTRGSLSLLSIYPGKAFLKAKSKTQRREFFIAGILFLSGLVSLFMFAVFREKIFIYFGGLMFVMIGYFMSINNELGVLLNITQAGYTNQRQILVFCMISMFFLFIRDYLRLRANYPVFYKTYQAVSIFLLVLILGSIFAAQITILSFVDYGIFCWVLLSISLITYLAWKGDKAGRIMFLSIIFLALSSLFFLAFGLGNSSLSSALDGFQIGILIFSGVLFYGLFDKVNEIRQAKREAEDLGELKSRFFANISHEFRTPLTLMLGPIEQVMEATTDPRHHELLELAHRNADRQLNLVNQLLDLSRAESGHLKLLAAENNFVLFLKGAVHSYSSLAEQKNITLRLYCPEDKLLVYYDEEKMEKIIYNLVSNAFKFTPEGGCISIALTAEKSTIHLEIKDSGIGIAADRLPHVFDRFFRGEADGHDHYDGYGIGLALVKELVQLHQGHIRLESVPGEGTTALLEFPRGKSHLKPHEISVSDKSVVVSPSRLIEPWIAEEEEDAGPATVEGKTRILLIEDNTDVRAFIRQKLVGNYEVLEAVDGEEGIRKAVQYIPDLIISDVMMPKKNGYEVCKAVKTDVRTSHIPIIMLTAKATRENKLEGLETGADDYLTKPFDARELEIRVNNLIQIREQLRQRFATEITLQPTEIATNSLDQVFLQELMTAIETNMGEEQFGVEDLARAANMSRSNLNRKLRALVNQSANQFIQSIRLQRAADLLRQQAGTVGEVAFQTGFSSTAYFVKCFKDKYGQTPGSFWDPS